MRRIVALEKIALAVIFAATIIAGCFLYAHMAKKAEQPRVAECCGGGGHHEKATG